MTLKTRVREEYCFGMGVILCGLNRIPRQQMTMKVFLHKYLFLFLCHSVWSVGNTLACSTGIFPFPQSVFNPCESVAHSGIVVVACVVLSPGPNGVREGVQCTLFMTGLPSFS